MKSNDNPYRFSQISSGQVGLSQRRKRLNPLALMVSLTIVWAIFTVLSPALDSAEYAGLTPEWMKTYVVPLSAPVYQLIAGTILMLALGFIFTTAMFSWVAWVQTRRFAAATDGNTDGTHHEMFKDVQRRTASAITDVQKCTNNPMDRRGGSAAS